MVSIAACLILPHRRRRVASTAGFGAAVEAVPLGGVVRCGYVLPGSGFGGGAQRLGQDRSAHVGGSPPPAVLSRRGREEGGTPPREDTLSQEQLHRRLVLVEEALAQAGLPLPTEIVNVGVERASSEPQPANPPRVAVPPAHAAACEAIATGSGTPPCSPSSADARVAGSAAVQGPAAVAPADERAAWLSEFVCTVGGV